MDDLNFHNKMLQYHQNNSYNYKNLKYFKKKKKFVVFDGIAKITIDSRDMKCRLCRSNTCKHTNFILSKHYGIKNNLLPMLKVKSFVFNYDTFTKDISDYFKEYECCVCLGSLERDRYFWSCENCSQLIHYNCVREWNKNICPLCNQQIYL